MSERPEAPSVRATTVTFAYILSVSPPSTPKDPKSHKGSTIISVVACYSLEQTKVRHRRPSTNRNERVTE